MCAINSFNLFNLVLFCGRGMPEGGKMDPLDFKEEILPDGKVLSVGQLSQAFYFSVKKTGLSDWFSEIS